jgi:predicted TIM-barrel fold metal-dependent hydrolase
VSHVDLRLGDKAHDVLAQHVRMPRVRGVRNMTAWHADPAITNPDLVTTPGMLGEPAFRQGFAALREFGLTFDAWLFVPQIPELTSLACAFPDTKDRARSSRWRDGNRHLCRPA